MPSRRPSTKQLIEKYSKKQTAKATLKAAPDLLGDQADIIMTSIAIGSEAYAVYNGTKSIGEAFENQVKLGTAVYGGAYGKKFFGDKMARSVQAVSTQNILAGHIGTMLVDGYSYVCAKTTDEKAKIAALAGAKVMGKVIGASIGSTLGLAVPIVGGPLGATIGQNIGEAVACITADYMLATFPEKYWETMLGAMFRDAQSEQTTMQPIVKNWWDNDYTYLERVRHVYVEYEKDLKAFQQEISTFEAIIDSPDMDLDQLQYIENILEFTRKKHAQLEKKCYQNVNDIVGVKDKDTKQYPNIENASRYEGYKRAFSKSTRQYHTNIREDRKMLLEKIASKREELTSTVKQEQRAEKKEEPTNTQPNPKRLI